MADGGRKRVLDSTALYDAVATQDTVTMLRGSIRALLGIVDGALHAELRRDPNWKARYRATRPKAERKLAHGYELLHCPSCGGKMVLLACVMQRAVITKILSRLGLPTEPPRPAKARASPLSQAHLDYVA